MLNTRTLAVVLAAFLATLSSLPAGAAEDAALLKDLNAVIALLGQPCGQVVSATRLKADDHVATCSNGSRYHVFINAAGKVVAEKR